jgi:acylpyruvate hydrolase
MHQGRQFAAAIVGEQAVPIRGVAELGDQTPIELLTQPPLQTRQAIPVDEIVLAPVVPRPGKIVCVGLNYLAHVGETGRDIHEYPVLFTKFAETLCGPYDPIVLPPESEQVDYEAELAVVIGRTGRRIDPEDVLGHVAGYTIANDVTMRDYQYKTQQWLQGKAWQDSTPLGPWLVTPDEVGDPSQLELRLSVNDRTLQSASTAQMMFDVPALVSHVSRFVTLRPGDVLLTGTPGGVGFRREPQVFLRPGDRVRVEISGLGELDNLVAAELACSP